MTIRPKYMKVCRWQRLFAKAGLPKGEQIRGPLMATCVMVEAAHGYRVLFSLAELDSSFLDSDVLVADTMDGSAIRGTTAPTNWLRPTRSGRGNA